MKRWWWIGMLVLTTIFSGCRGKLPARSAEERALDRAVVALAVGHRRSVPVSQNVPRGTFEPPAELIPVAVKTLVTVYLQPDGNCPPCHTFRSWWDGLSAEAREKLPCTFRLEQTEIPEWVTSFPAFHWSDAEGKSWYCNGWEGIDSFLIRFQGTVPEARTMPHEKERNLMAPAGADLGLNGGDWSRLMGEMLRSGEIPLNSQYSLWVPSAESLRWNRTAAQGELRFDAPFPLLRLKWHGLRYDDTVRKLTVSPGKVSVTLGTFGEIAFAARPP
ncbi:MAG: hypothetical protein U0903_00825 [Planctomycetales bacterium]